MSPRRRARPAPLWHGCALADYDGDGSTDIFITALGENALYRNRGEGTFEDATARAGVAGGRWTDRSGASHPEWSTAAAWADFDLDGDLDLLVTHYVLWFPGAEIFTTLDGIKKAFTTPEGYRGSAARLPEPGRRDLRGRDRRIGPSSGRWARAWGSRWDFDRDGLPDGGGQRHAAELLLITWRRAVQGGRPRGGIAYDVTGPGPRRHGDRRGAAWRNDGKSRGRDRELQPRAADPLPLVVGGRFEDIAAEARLTQPTYSPADLRAPVLDY
jgi:hypothetical protein